MIRYSNIKAENLYTEGFITSEPSPLALAIESGKTIQTMQIAEETVTKEFPAFQFEIEPDDEFPVIYDIYLLERNSEQGVNIHVDRTEIGLDKTPFYEGDTPLFLLLSSFVVPPGSTSLENVDIEIRTVVLDEERLNNDSNPS